VKPRRFWLAICLAGLVSGCFDNRTSSDAANAAANSALSAVFPRLTGRVVDGADLLRPEQELDLSAKSEALEAQTGRQFVVVTVTSLSGQDVATYTRDLGRHWGIGNKDRDDGVILLVAPNERQVRIAVGYGLERTLTDSLAKQILDEQVLPEFRRGEIATGIVGGADAIVAELSRPPNLVSGTRVN